MQTRVTGRFPDGIAGSIAAMKGQTNWLPPVIRRVRGKARTFPVWLWCQGVQLLAGWGAGQSPTSSPLVNRIGCLGVSGVRSGAVACDYLTGPDLFPWGLFSLRHRVDWNPALGTP
ncbi:MAG: hypothetical protein DWH82_06490 [Planctomycetota bacterium]|nr:MAG: hypothetical protein DWH82_06490 [Planctomycetota bacterium]